MRIAFVLPGSGGGGVRSVVRVATGLIERGHDLTLYFRQQSSDFRDRLRRIYYSLWYRRGEGWLAGFPGRAIPYRGLREDVVGDHDLIVGVGVSCVLEFQHLPVRCGIKVNNSRGVEPWCMEEMYRAWALPMPRIVVGSHLVRLMREAGSQDPIFVAPNGIDAANYFPSQSEGLRDGVGVVYHGAHVKDPELILGALNELGRRRPSLPFYVFSTFPRPAGLPAHTHFARFPSLAAARDMFSRSLVWFMASRNEGFGNPLLEAASCGCALVSTDCGGATDIIEHGRSGLIVPVSDSAAMVRAIERLLDDSEMRAQFRARAMDTARRFNWDHAIDRFEQALIEISRMPENKRGSHALAPHAAC